MSLPRYSVLLTSAIVSAFLLMCSFTPGESTPPATTNIETPTAEEQPVLVELFTSQGCSSCPPADQVLQTLDAEAAADQLSVITLSYHVDYWNRLGWRDPYSQAAFSDRQREYARHLNDRGVYTPQAVVNGRQGHIGSRERELRAAVTKASQLAPPSGVRAKATWSTEGEMMIAHELSDVPAKAVLQIAIVQGRLANEVPRGENRGRHLTHTNVVRKLVTINDWQTKGQTTISLDEDLERVKEDLHVVVFVQSTEDMRVLGVSRITLS